MIKICANMGMFRFKVILTTVLAACGAAKLDKNYLPPITAKTAGGSPGSLLAPVENLPTGSYTNDAQGVVVDAAAPGTRAAGGEPTGLGAPRTTYGSTDSKVGDAAFGSLTGPNTRIAPGFESITGVEGNTGPSIRIAPGFNEIVAPQGTDDDKTRASTLKFANEIGLENYSYGFETDNGIAIGENGVAADGVKAQGGYSYKGDDGKVYSVKYTADEGGYKPHGSHLPTPPPIPEEILKSLEQNAKEEAAGLVDDGSYDAQKYNDEGDYSSSNGDDYNNRQSTVNGVTKFGNQEVNAHLGAHSVGSHSLNSNTFKTQGHNTPTGGQHSQSFTQSQVGYKPINDIQTGSKYNQGSGFYSQTTQNRFGQTEKAEGNSATAVASTVNTQTGQPKYTSLRLPTASTGNSAYSSAVTTGTGSASAYASTGSAHPDFKNQFGVASQGYNYNTVYSSGASFPNYPVNPLSATATATAQGQDASAEALVTGTQFNGGSYQHFSQNKASGLGSHENVSPVKIVESTGPVISSFNTQGTGASESSSALENQSTFGQSINQLAQPIQPINKVPTNFGGASQTTSNAATTASNFGSQPFGEIGSQISSSTSGTGSQNSFIKPGQYTQTIPTKIPVTELSTPFEANETADKNKPIFGSSNSQLPSSAPTQPSFSQISQQGLSQYKPQTASSTPKPYDQSYYYNQPAKPFITSFPNNRQPNLPVSSISQQGSKYSNTPVDSSAAQTTASQSGQYQETTGSSHSGITQASISPFQSAGPPSSTQFGSQSSQFGSKPSSFPSSSQTQFGSTGNQQTFAQKPVTQFGQIPFGPSQTSQFGHQSSSQSVNEQKPAQGTVYEYNKPSSLQETTSTSAQVTSSQTKPGQTFFASQGNQQKPFGSSSSFQQNQGSTTQTESRFGEKPIFQTQTSQFGQQSSSSTANIKKPEQGTIYEYNKPSSPSGSVTSGQTSFGSQSTQFANQQKPFGSNSAFQKTQSSNTQTSSQFGQKPIVQSQTSQFGHQSFSSAGNVQYPGQGTIYEYNKPSSHQETTSTFAQVTSSQTDLHNKPVQNPLGSQGIQFGNQQSKPFGSNSAFQQTQGSTTETPSQFGQKPIVQSQTTQFGQQSFSQAANVQKPEQGTIYEYNKPTYTSGQVTSSQTKPSQTSFGSQGTQFGNQQQPLGSSSLFQHSQGSSFGTHTTDQFGQKPIVQSQTTQFGQQSSSQTANVQKPGQGTIYEYNKPSSASESTTSGQTSSGSQVSQFGNQQKPFGSSSTFQQTQGSNTQTGTQFGQKPIVQSQTSQFGQQSLSQTGNVQKPGQGSVYEYDKPTHTSGYQSSQGTQLFNQQKPISSGSSFQQTQGSNTQTSSQFGQKPIVQSQISQFGQQSISQTGNVQKPEQGAIYEYNKPTYTSGYQSSQGTQFSNQQKPISSGSSFQQTQGSNTQTSSQFGQKPIVQSQISQFGQQSISQTGNVQKPEQGAIYEYNKPTYTSGYQSSQGTQFSNQQKPISSGPSFQQTQGSNTQTSSQFGHGPIVQSQTSQFGQQSFSQTGNIQKPGQGTIYEYKKPGSQQETTSTFAQVASSQNKPGQISFGTQSTQFGNQQSKPVGSISSFQQTQTQSSTFGSQKPQIGQSTGSFSSFQNKFGQSQFNQKPLGSVNTGSNVQQTQSGSSTTSQFGSSGSKFEKPDISPVFVQQNQGSIYEYNKPAVNLPTNKETTAFSGSQVGQGSSANSGIQNTQFGYKPFGSSQIISTITQQTQSPSLTSQPAVPFGQKPQINQGTGFSSSQSGFNFQQTQFGSKFGSQYVQKPKVTGFSNKDQTQTGQKTETSTVAGSAVQQTQSTQGSIFGSQSSTSSFPTRFGQKPSQGVSSTSSVFSQSQNSQFGIKPFSTSQSVSTAGSKIENKPVSTTISNTANSQSIQTSYQFGQKPFGALSNSQFTQNAQGSGQTFGSQSQTPFNLKPISTSQTSFGTSTGSTFDQKPQSVFTSSTKSKVQPAQTSQFGQKPFGSSQTGSSFQQTGFQLGQKPTTSSSSFVSSIASKGQTIETTQFGVKPFGSAQSTSSSVSQTQFGTTTGNKFDQKPSSVSQTYSGNQQSQFGQGLSSASESTSKGQAVQFGITPTSSIQTTSSSLSQTQIGSTFGSKFGQKPQSGLETISATSLQSQPISQFGYKPLGSQNIQQNQFGTFESSQLGQSTGSQAAPAQTFGVTQTQFGSFTSQKPQSSLETISNISQFQTTPQPDKKVFGSQTTFEQNRFDVSTSSQLGQNSNSQAIQTIQEGQQPLGSSQGTSTFSQSQSSSAGINSQATPIVELVQKPISSSQGGYSFSKTQVSSTTGTKFGQTTQSGTETKIPPQIIPIFQYKKEQFGSQTTPGSQAQYASTTGPQIGQNIGSQVQTGQAQFGQKPALSNTQTSSSIFSQSSQSSFESQEKKPFGPNQPSTQFGTTFEEKPQNVASGFPSSVASLDGSQASKNKSPTKLSTQPQKPFGSSFTTTSQQQNNQFPNRFGSSETSFQHSQITASQQPFNSQSTTTKFGQKIQPSKSNIHTTVTSISSESTSQSTDSEEFATGYNYQKPQSTLNTASRFGDKQKTTSFQTNFGSQDSTSKLNDSPHFTQHSIEPFDIDNAQDSQSSFGSKPFKPTCSACAQFGVKPSTQVSFEQLQTASKFGVKPTETIFVNSPKSSQTFGLNSQPVGSVQPTSFPTPVSLGFTGDSSNEGSSVSTVQTPVSGEVGKENGFLGEVFGGPRVPPRFDDKSGYHY